MDSKLTSVHKTNRNTCRNCGSIIDNDRLFCIECEEICSSLSEEFENNSIELVDRQLSSEEPETPIGQSALQSPDFLCLALLIGCAFLWFTAPFIAINILSIGDQPTAFQLVTGDVFVIGDVTQTTAFIAAVASIIGTIVCFISEATSSHNITRAIAIITEIPIGLALFDTLGWFDYVDDFSSVIDVLGVGFWGIMILFLIVIFLSGNSAKNQST